MSGETPTTPTGGTPVPPTTTPTPAPTPSPTPGETPSELTWEGWYKGQPDDIRRLIDDQVSGLKSALASERGTRGALEKQLKDLAKKAEQGSEIQQALQKLQTDLGEENVKASFYEAAHAAGASDLRLAYLAARDAGLIDDRGKFNLDEVKARFPVLFATPKPVVPSANAGSGTAQGAPAPSGNAAVNQWIRGAAGLK